MIKKERETKKVREREGRWCKKKSIKRDNETNCHPSRWRIAIEIPRTKCEHGNPVAVAVSVSVLRIGQSFRRATQINIKFDILCRIGSALSCHVLR